MTAAIGLWLVILVAIVCTVIAIGAHTEGGE